MWTNRLAALVGALVAVVLSFMAIAIGVLVGASFLPARFGLALLSATLVPALFASLVAVPVGQLVYRRLRRRGSREGEKTSDEKHV